MLECIISVSMLSWILIIVGPVNGLLVHDTKAFRPNREIWWLVALNIDDKKPWCGQEIAGNAKGSVKCYCPCYFFYPISANFDFWPSRRYVYIYLFFHDDLTYIKLNDCHSTQEGWVNDWLSTVVGFQLCPYRVSFRVFAYVMVFWLQRAFWWIT